MVAARGLQSDRLRSPFVRIPSFAFLAIGGLALLLFLIHQLVLPVLAWLLPTHESFFYDLAVFGVYRTAEYVTFKLAVPHGQMMKWDKSCEGGHVLIAPFGPSVDRPGPMILDSHGELVWTADLHQTVTNLDVQMYQGDPYLTFWAGDKHGGAGTGAAFMLDSSYNIPRQITAVGQGLRTDLHEFAISEDGHALISTINVTRVDMKGLAGIKQGWIEDSVFQEIDIETGQLIFQWRAQDHYTPEDSHFWNPIGGYIQSRPYDFFHLNSIQRDSKGNYLISARHLHKIAYIDGQTGNVLWTLGGEDTNDFIDLSGRLATSFRWQHHARLREDSTLTLLDNGRAGLFQRDTLYSKGLMLNVDQDNRTVELLHSFVSMNRAQSSSQGSVQTLPNGNVLVGWGPVAAWSEHKPNGELLCEYHFAAAWSFGWRRVKNYRTFKVYNWRGEPHYPPTAKLKDGKVYVSWNGATEVRFWKLQGIHYNNETSEETHEDIEIIDKQGFESAFVLPQSASHAGFRVAALDSEKNLIQRSALAKTVESNHWWTGRLVFVTCFIAAFASGVWLSLRIFARRRRHWQQSGWELATWRRYKYSRL